MSNPDLVPGEPSLKTDLDTWRGAGGSFAVNLSPASGLPAIVVPAGFTRVIYDRVPDAGDPNVAMEFLGRPFDEAQLFEIASAGVPENAEQDSIGDQLAEQLQSFRRQLLI